MFLASVDCVFLALRSSENPKEGINGKEEIRPEISRRTPCAELFRLKKTVPIIQRQCSLHFYRERAQALPCSLREWRTQVEHLPTSVPAGTAPTRPGSRSWSVRTRNSARPTISRRSHRPILPKRNSTTCSADNCLHQRVPRGLLGRAGPPNSADGFVDFQVHAAVDRAPSAASALIAAEAALAKRRPRLIACIAGLLFVRHQSRTGWETRALSSTAA